MRILERGAVDPMRLRLGKAALCPGAAEALEGRFVPPDETLLRGAAR